MIKACPLLLAAALVCCASPPADELGLEHWERSEQGWISPQLRAGSGTRLVVRIRAAGAFDVSWRTAESERRLSRLESSKPWSTEILSVPLPADETGRVRLHGRDDLDLSLAEMLGPGEGRCYADTVRVEKVSREAFVCARRERPYTTARQSGPSCWFAGPRAAAGRSPECRT